MKVNRRGTKAEVKKLLSLHASHINNWHTEKATTNSLKQTSALVSGLTLYPSTSLVKESQNLTSRLLPPGLLVRHNPVRSTQNNLPKLPRWQKVHNPFLNFVDRDVKTGRDNSAFVQAAIKLNYDFLRAVVINDFKLANVPCVEITQR